ncbi:hypothetical protein ARALYDRAFT_913974 [Arabidopsis lyrata subsp. lyrata]|uniref:Uncharacterized protein n=1 Tax=Arabidopsis lyrata subsp. lyrata TaxID=81972 RepID=D7MFV3_ARALL|nr:hypothetical protein ARALYDRAFT_913974 [Arabidopsis lyrata subsp. lyrata]
MSQRHKNVRLFSTPAYPYLLIDHILNTVHSSEGRFSLHYGFYCPSHLKEEVILIKDKELVDEVRHAMTCACYQSGVRFHMPKQTFLSIHYQDPSDPKSKPVIVDLPPLPKGEYLCSLDLHFKEGDHPEFNHMWNEDLPRSLLHELHELNSLLRTDHLVESPSGEKFLVKW